VRPAGPLDAATSIFTHRDVQHASEYFRVAKADAGLGDTRRHDLCRSTRAPPLPRDDFLSITPMPISAVLSFATLLGAGGWAAREDLLTHRVPNKLTGCLLCVGLALGLSLGGWRGVTDAILGTLVGLGILLPFHLLRAMGAGDVKLLAAFGSLLGPHWTFLAGIYTILIGGVLAIGYVLVGSARAAAVPERASLMARLQRASARAYQLRRERFPYAIAIAFGALSAALERGDLESTIAYLSGALT
jgi:prepilin peptidase CpaA